MAITVIKTVKPSGGDYTSLSAWEAGEQRDLVTLNEIAVAECYSMSETTAVTVMGFTTDATHYVEIRTPLSERHKGKWDSTKYNLVVVDSDALVLSDDHVRVYGLQVAVSSTQYGRNGISISFPNVGAQLQIAHNIIDGQANILSASGIASSSTGNEVVKIWNNIVYGFNKGWNGGIEISACAVGSYVFNNTAYSCQYGFKINTTNVVLKNNLSAANNRNGYIGTFSASSDYNASDDTTSTGGAHDRISQPFTFVDVLNRDLHLVSTDAGARDLGVDLSTFYTDDIDGQTRTGTWDIGADEYIAAGGGPILVSGNTAGGSAYSGALSSDLAAGGTAASISSATGLAGFGLNALGATAVLSVLSASAGLQRYVGGAINGLSASFGALTTTATTALSGSIAAQTVLNGGVALIRSVSGPITGISTLFASAAVFAILQGAISGVSFLTASVTGRPVNYLSGRVDALSTFAGGVSMGYGLGGASVSGLLISAHLNEIYSSAGVISSASLVTGFPVLSGWLSSISLAESPRFDVTRYGGGFSPTVQMDSRVATVTQDNNNPRVTR